MKNKIRGDKLWPAFKNVAILFSFSLNVLMLGVLIIAAFWVIPSVNQLAKPIVGDLSRSVDDMVSAHIVQTIQVQDQIPINFELPVSTVTNAEIMQAVPMAVDTSFVLPAGGGTINGTVYFELPQGTLLPVALNINVPVSQTVPIQMTVGVDIALEETEMGPPLLDLKKVIAHFDQFLVDFPASNREFFKQLTSGTEAVELPSEPISGR